MKLQYYYTKHQLKVAMGNFWNENKNVARNIAIRKHKKTEANNIIKMYVKDCLEKSTAADFGSTEILAKQIVISSGSGLFCF